MSIGLAIKGWKAAHKHAPKYPAAARPLAILGGVALIVGALLPWATFLLNKGAYPEKATLQFFDAPFELAGFRLHTLLFGIAALIVIFLPVAVRGRTWRALGVGAGLIAIINGLYITVEGGGFGAITAAGDTVALGAIIALVGAVSLILGGIASGIGVPVRWALKVPWPVAWLILLASFAGLLWIVSDTLTAGGRGGPANPYASAVFLSFLGFLAGLFGALAGLGLIKWVSGLSEQHRILSVVVLLGCALALPFTEAGTAQWMFVATNIGVYAATAIGLNIVVGLAGLLDLGYVAFMGIGAFVAANLSGAMAARFDVTLPFPVVAVIAAVIAGIFGAFVGSPTLRVRGDYLAIVTLAFGEIFTRAAQNNIGGLTGGSNAIPNQPPLDFFGTAYNESITIGGTELPTGVMYYFLIVLIVAAVMWLFANLKNSRIGRAWIAVREDEDAARAMGIRTGKVKILAFLVGASIAGVAGAVFIHQLAVASYESFRFLESVTLLAAVILGGMGTIPGAVLGASLLFVLPEKLREFQDYRLMIFGLALVLIMRFRPQGLVPDRVRRAEFAGESETGIPLEQLEEQAVLEQEAAEREHAAPAGPREARS